MRKRILSLILAIVTVLVAVPFSVLPAMAAGESNTSSSTENTTYATRFSANDNFPVFDSYNASLMQVGASVKATYPGAWQIGYKTKAGSLDNFTPYEKLIKAADGNMVLSYDAASITSWGGMYITGETPRLMFSGSAANPAVRYTAEFTGIVVIRLDQLYFKASNTNLEILHNDTPITSYAANTNYNRGADLGVVVVELQAGDTLDFISASNATGAQGLYDLDIEISYRSAKDGSASASSVGTSVTTAVPTILPLFVWCDAQGNQLTDGAVRHAPRSSSSGSGTIYQSLVHLIHWFDTEGDHAIINPALIANGIITSTANYATVLSQYKAYLKSFAAKAATYESAFQFGSIQGNAFSPFNSFPLISGRNLFSVKQATSSTLAAEVDYSFATDRLVGEASLNSAIDAFFANASVISPSGTQANNYRITTSQLPTGLSYSTEGTDAAANGSAVYKGGKLYLVPGANGSSALSYTIPESLDRTVFKLAVNGLTFDGNAAAFRYAVAVNNKVVWPADGWAQASSLSDIQAALASLSFEANAKDTVSLCVARADSDVSVSLDLTVTVDNYHNVRTLEIVGNDETIYRGIHLFGSTVTLSDLDLPEGLDKSGVLINNVKYSQLPDTLTMDQDYYIADRVLEVTAGLVINSAFAVNVYVQAEADATAAGVILDGETKYGESQGNGVFCVTIPMMPKEMPDKVLSFKAFQVVDGEQLINARSSTVNAFALLTAYESSEDEHLALLATTIRYYCLAARDYFINDALTLDSAAKTALKAHDTAISAMVGSYGTSSSTAASGFAFSLAAASLKIDDQLGFAFLVEHKNSQSFGSADGLRLLVTDAYGEQWAKAPANEPFDYAGKEMMMYLVTGLPATEYATELLFTLVDGNNQAVSATMTYSAYAYIARVFDKAAAEEGSTETPFHYVLRGIYALGEASTAYADAHVNFDKDYQVSMGDNGDDLTGSSVLTDVSYDASNATTIAGSALASTTLTNGKVYKVTGNATLPSSYNGNGAVLLAPDGLTVDGKSTLTLSNITVVGAVTIKNSQNILLEDCRILNEDATAISVDENSSVVAINRCRVVGFHAIDNAASELTVMNSYLGFRGFGLRDTAEFGTTVQNCRLESSGKGDAISSVASEAIFRFNTVKLDRTSSRGIVLASGSETATNILVAQNVITGTFNSILVSGTLNTSVVLNSAVTVRGMGNKNLYVCDNAVGGRLVLQNNNYLLANGNMYPNDQVNHAADATGNTNTNGDSLMDVHARLATGADPNLLPHIDKDLFLSDVKYMNRKEAVRDIRTQGGQALHTYLLNEAKSSNIVVVAPGAYLADNKTSADFAEFKAVHANTTVYAYGVYAEATTHYRIIRFADTSNFTVKGLTVGYADNLMNGGQVYVLQKLGGNQIKVVAGAGFENEFSTTHSTLRGNTDFVVHRKGDDDNYHFIGETYLESVTKNSDGTMTITLRSGIQSGNEDTPYNLINKGDVLTCRTSNYPCSIEVARSKDVKLEDVTHYGFAGAYAFYEVENKNGVEYHRVVSTSKPAEVIDQATYNKYVSLTSTYGVDLEVSKETLSDGTIRYRGSEPKVGSLDGIHVGSGGSGPKVISSIIENMTDDGSNTNSYHSRLGGYIDNGDGTLTLIYKGNLTGRIYADGNASGAYNNRNCAPFRVGDYIQVYTADGQEVCNTPVIEVLYTVNSIGQAASCYDTVISNYTGVFANIEINRYAVVVEKNKVNLGALAGYDLNDNSHIESRKVLVDNVSRGSTGAMYDNSVFRNGIGSGIRLKSADGLIKNCTLEYLAKPGISLTIDFYWGESGIASGTKIINNIIGPTSYSMHGIKSLADTSSDYKSTPIAIMGLGGTSCDENHLLFKDITIEGNTFIRSLGSIENYTYAIYARSVKNLVIKNNNFGTLPGETSSTHCGVLYLNGATDVTLSGNTYSSFVNSSNIVGGNLYVNIHDASGNPIVNDNPNA